MKTSSFLTGLRAHAALPLVFRHGDEVVSPGYHLTEVKRVAYETMDCGAMTHRWAESHFEVWVPASTSANAARGHMPAEKFLRIVDRVEAELPLNREAAARIHAAIAGAPAALYDVDRIEARDGELRVELTADRTRCKAAERRAVDSAGGCCGAATAERVESEAAAGCGCGSPKSETAAPACCA